MDQQAPTTAISESQRTVGERFRGSSEVPLSARGLEQANGLGIDFARKGGLDEVKTSNLGRAVQTARAINKFTHAPITYMGGDVHPWHLGSMEGTPVTPEKIDFLNHLIKDSPDEKIPGRGPISTADGESFNDFKTRTLTYMRGMLHQVGAQPMRKIGLVTHYRVKKLMDAWMRKGAQDDLTIDPETMTSNTSDHGTAGVSRLVYDGERGPQEFDVDMDSPAQLSGGLYMIRHGQTAYNNQQS